MAYDYNTVISYPPHDPCPYCGKLCNGHGDNTDPVGYQAVKAHNANEHCFCDAEYCQEAEIEDMQ